MINFTKEKETQLREARQDATEVTLFEKELHQEKETSKQLREVLNQDQGATTVCLSLLESDSTEQKTHVEHLKGEFQAQEESLTAQIEMLEKDCLRQHATIQRLQQQEQAWTEHSMEERSTHIVQLESKLKKQEEEAQDRLDEATTEVSRLMDELCESQNTLRKLQDTHRLHVRHAEEMESREDAALQEALNQVQDLKNTLKEQDSELVERQAGLRQLNESLRMKESQLELCAEKESEMETIINELKQLRMRQDEELRTVHPHVGTIPFAHEFNDQNRALRC